MTFTNSSKNEGVKPENLFPLRGNVLILFCVKMFIHVQVYTGVFRKIKEFVKFNMKT